MQKLSGISSGKNNKSCRIFHNEYNKIGFAFFRFFYDFLCNLQKSGKSLILFQLPFCSSALEKKYLSAMWSLGAGSGAARRNPASSPAFSAGRGRGRVYGPQGLGLGGCLALGGGRRAAHRRPVAAATAGSTVAWRALGRELGEARWVS
jgi:hypothetical protein